MADHISPTYATGTYSIMSNNQVGNLNNDYYNRTTLLTGSTVVSGYVNVLENKEVGSFNADQNNMILSKVPCNQFTQQS